ncbi:MAG: recombination mediator RecR [Candidatus Saccharibacteria bacterium]|nr:recombination mediator RecR [Candidatus Saccharibacteria bacterium]
MSTLPKALDDLIEALGQLPGVGPRSAERYAYFLLKNDTYKSKKLADTLERLHANVAYCPITFALIDPEDKVSRLYSDNNRDKKVVALVADAFDIIALEKTSLYRGTYHVLGGLISPIDGIGPEQLHIPELKKRIKDDEVKEIILATNASVEGETTALYVQQELAGLDLTITRLARGLPIGVDLEYADQITLGRALEGRQSF